jgi:transcription termination factor Rho
MTKTELEKKHLSDLHLLASEAGIEKYRLLTKAELIDRLAEGDGNGAPSQTKERQERPRRRRSSSGTREPRDRDEREPRDRPEKAPEREPAPEPVAKEERSEPAKPAEPTEPARPRRRRRRRFGRRKQGVTLQTLLLPPEAGRQTLVFAETRDGCTALLRSVAADLSADSKGPDPVALLIDPSPEELADWKREAPQAEIVSAGQPRHASDALAQAATRAGKGEDVILLVDSLTRLGEAYGDAEAAKEFFDAGRERGSQGGGSLTVVAALERPNGD